MLQTWIVNILEVSLHRGLLWQIVYKLVAKHFDSATPCSNFLQRWWDKMEGWVEVLAP